MRKKIFLIFILVFVLFGCNNKTDDLSSSATLTPTQIISSDGITDAVSPTPKPEPVFNSTRKAGELPDISVQNLYLTVKEGTTEETNHTWEEINRYSASDYDNMGVDRYKMSCWLDDSPDSDDTASENPDGTVSFRGQASSRAVQKSYKIKLDSLKWMNQKVLNLNKHFPDSTRILNKLAYDIIDEVPQLIGLQTQFVQLYVKDLSDDSGLQSSDYENYGLFTHVEQLNKRALKRLNLDPDGALYKVNGFEFWEYNDVKLTTDPEFNLNNFEVRLENKGDTENDKLISLMDAINNGTVSDQELLDYYVDIDNVAYWMAFQILIDNVDTNCRNFYIYSPTDSRRWYIISWDNDGAFSHLRSELSGSEAVPWRSGVTDYWGNCLFRNLLRTSDFRNAVLNAATDLKDNYLTKEHISELLSLYKDATEPVIYNSRDNEYFHSDYHDWLLERIPSEIEVSYERLVDSLNKPTPYFIGAPQYSSETNEVYIGWNESYDFDHQKLTYIIEITKDPSFKDVLYTTETEETNITYTHEWGTGCFYVRISAKNEDGFIVRALTTSWNDDFGNIYGAQSYNVE